MFSQAKAKPPLNGAFVPIALTQAYGSVFSQATTKLSLNKAFAPVGLGLLLGFAKHLVYLKRTSVFPHFVALNYARRLKH